MVSPCQFKEWFFLRVGVGGLRWWLRCTFKNIKVFSVRRGDRYKDIEKNTLFISIAWNILKHKQKLNLHRRVIYWNGLDFGQKLFVQF